MPNGQYLARAVMRTSTTVPSDRLVTWLILGAIALIYIPTITVSFIDHRGWALGDLHIDYAAGFIRRGLLGQIAYVLQTYLDIETTDFFGFVFAALTVTQVILLARLARPLASAPALFALVLLAPALLLFPAYDFNGYFRKDIFITLGLLVHALAHSNAMAGSEDAKRKYAVFLRFFLTPYLTLAMLIHENQVFFLPAHALLIYSAYDYPPLVRHLVQTQTPVFLPAMAVLILAIVFRGGPGEADAICRSWRGHALIPCDAIEAVGWPYEKVYSYLRELLIAPASLAIFAAFFALALIPPLVARVYLKNQRSILIRGELLAVALFPAAILFALGWDWGRWIHLISMALTSLVLSTARTAQPGVPRMFAGAPAYGLVLLYVATWRMDACCLPTEIHTGLIPSLQTFFTLFSM